MRRSAREPEAAEVGSWHANVVCYQVYLPSFLDTDGDGRGDLAGVRAKLPYLCELGVSAIWLSPCYPSPLADGGYDVADYRGIRPDCGDMADMAALIDDAHTFGIKVLLDIVPNHTSDRHPWFQATLAAVRAGAPAPGRYIVRTGRAEGQAPPNNWRSLFGGSAWTQIRDDSGTGTGQWYLHMFAPEQPDLNWTDPAVRAEFEDILVFWFDRGIDGFRIDVAHGLFKDPMLPDVDLESATAGMLEATEDSPYWGRPEVFDLWASWRRVADRYPDRLLIGEAWAPNVTELSAYVHDRRLHQVFNFDGFLHRFTAEQWPDTAGLRRAIDDWLAATAKENATATWVLENHDVPRLVTRLGGGSLGKRRAETAGLLLLALPGAVYLYQGQELGLPEVELPDEVRTDPIFLRARERGQRKEGRDGCRVPIGWAGSAPPYGFGPEGSAPWLPQPVYWADYTVERQAQQPNSTLRCYRAALRHRKHIRGVLRWMPDRDGLLAFARDDGFRCVLNVSADSVVSTIAHTDYTVLIGSGPVDTTGPTFELPPDTAVWLRHNHIAD